MKFRNWSGYYFIFGWRPRKSISIKEDGGYFIQELSRKIPTDMDKIKELGLEDTFYWE